MHPIGEIVRWTVSSRVSTVALACLVLLGHESARAECEKASSQGEAIKCLEARLVALERAVNFQLETKELAAPPYKDLTKVLGPTSDYVIWALAGQSAYRHGASAGLLKCEIYVESGSWVLKAIGGDQQVGFGGSNHAWCKAIGLRNKK